MIPEKVVAYKDIAYKIKDNCLAKIIPNEKHISILLIAHQLIAEAIQALPNTEDS